jgi:L-ascorbate metabolism protein UlaG (beta-lactamase superfamily)
MRWLLFVLLPWTQMAFAGWDDYKDLVVADEAPTSGGIRVTYLGVNGYQFECRGHALLVDPYFSRPGVAAFAFGSKVEPDAIRVAEGLRHVRPQVDALLVTHAHIDHLLDAVPIMRKTGARLIAGPTAVNQVKSLGIPAAKCWPVGDGDQRKIGPWTIHSLKAQHDRLLGSVPYPGEVPKPASPPEKPSDWVLGEPLAFVIEAEGLRIYIEAGGVPGVLPPEMKVDLAILGVALRDSRQRFAPAVRALHPRYTLPSHQDDFFTPFERGFSFGKFTDFPAVIRTWGHEQLPGNLILLDYFRPWTLR